ncbi:MAG: hypothetical protein ABIK09_08340 [Pseudomonadota bacterium]
MTLKTPSRIVAAFILCLLTPAALAESSVSEEERRSVLASNTEIQEVKGGIELTKGAVEKLRSQLLESSQDLELAKEYYKKHIALIEALIRLHAQFIVNSQSEYRINIEKVRGQVINLIDETKAKIARYKREDGLPQTIIDLEMFLKRQEAVHVALRVASERLEEQRLWAEANLKRLHESLDVAFTAEKTLDVTSEAHSIVVEIMEKFEDLQVTAPPLIVFELPDDLKS